MFKDYKKTVKEQKHNWALFKNMPGFKIFICMVLSTCAFTVRTYQMIWCLALIQVVILIIFCGFKVSVLKELKLFVWQTVIITGLYMIRFGSEGGLFEGFKISIQLFLTFFPGIILVKSTSNHAIMNTLTQIMSYRVAFVLSTSIRFIPVVLNEIRSIYEMQLLRGAKIAPSDLIYPWYWSDFVNCLIIPAIIRSMVLAKEIALAAQARDFGIYKTRTQWSGE